MAALILREMSTRYGKTPGGYIWAVLEPLGAILFLSLGFSLLLRSPSLGTSFILFYASGYIPFNLYQNVSQTVSRSITFSRPLLFYPAVTWMDAIFARFLLNTLANLTTAYLLMTLILSMIDSNIVLDLVPIVTAMGLAALLGLGVGVLNCLLIGLFPTWEVFWSIVTRPLFLASGIIYIYEELPRTVQNILYYNPLMHITGMMRTGVFTTYAPEYVNPPMIVGCAMVPLALGLLLLSRHYKTILNN